MVVRAFGDSRGVDEGSPEICSFCMRIATEVGMLIEGRKRGQLQASSICQGCVELCVLIFERRRALAAEGVVLEGTSNEATRERLRVMVDERLGAFTDREREIIKLRYGLVGTEIHSFEDVCRHFQLTPECLRQLEIRAIAILAPGPEKGT